MSVEDLETRRWIVDELEEAGPPGFDEDTLLARLWNLERDALLAGLGDLVTMGVVVRREKKRWSLPTPNWSRRVDETQAWDLILEAAADRMTGDREFASPKTGQGYRMDAVDERGITIARLDANAPIRLTPDSARRAAVIMNAAGGVVSRGGIEGTVARETALVELHPELAWSDSGDRILAQPLSPAGLRETYLMTWNPARFDWKSLEDKVEQTARGEAAFTSWSSGSTKSVRPGERLVLIRLGVEPRGMMAIGTALTPVFEWPHWDTDASDEGKVTRGVVARWDRLVDPESSVLPMSTLEAGALADQTWSPQGSGTRVASDLVPELLSRWSAHSKMS